MKSSLCRRWAIALSFALFTLSAPVSSQTPLATAFTYQGRLLTGGVAAEGTYDLEFSLWDDPTSGTQIGVTQSVTGIEVADGLVEATLDFGVAAFGDETRWLQLAIQSAGRGSFTPLLPRRELTAAPAALYALEAGNAATVTSVSSLDASDGSPLDVVAVDDSGNVSLDGTTLYVSGSNNRVGIGTNTPVNAFHVVDAGTTVARFDGGSTPGTFLRITNTSANAADWNVVSGGLAAGNLPGPGNLGFSSGAIMPLMMTNSGSIGIGTNTPNARLAVSGTGPDMERITSSNTSGTWSHLVNGSTGGKIWSLISTGSANGEGAGHLLIRDTTSSAVRMMLSGTNGNIGIGTTTPSERLHVAGNIRLADEGRIFGLDRLVGFNDLQLYGDPTGGPDLFLAAGGNVGVGTTSPTALVHVAGTTPDTLRMTSSSTGGTWQYLANTSTGGKNWSLISTGSGNGEGAGHFLLRDSTSLAVRLMVSGTNGNVGIGTATPNARLHVQGTAVDAARFASSATSGTWLNLENSSTGGKTWNLISTGSANGEGAGQLLIRDATNGVRMTVRGDTGRVGIGTTNPSGHFEVQATTPSTDDTLFASYVGRFRNNNASNGDVLILEVGNETLTNGNNFIQFVRGGLVAGKIQGTGLGDGVEYVASGSDYAEELPRLDPEEAIAPGDLVGIFGGRVSRATAGADWVMVASTHASFVGNAEFNDAAEAARRTRVAFVGQAPVRVRGAVNLGDFIVASGANDGVGVAVAEDQLKLADAKRIAGRAWASSAEPGVKLVNIAVGLPSAQMPLHAVVARLQEQDERLRAQEERLERLEARLGADSAPSVVSMIPR